MLGNYLSFQENLILNKSYLQIITHSCTTQNSEMQMLVLLVLSHCALCPSLISDQLIRPDRAFPSTYPIATIFDFQLDNFTSFPSPRSPTWWRFPARSRGYWRPRVPCRFRRICCVPSTLSCLYHQRFSSMDCRRLVKLLFRF